MGPADCQSRRGKQKQANSRGTTGWHGFSSLDCEQFDRRRFQPTHRRRARARSTPTVFAERFTQGQRRPLRDRPVATPDASEDSTKQQDLLFDEVRRPTSLIELQDFALSLKSVDHVDFAMDLDRPRSSAKDPYSHSIINERSKLLSRKGLDAARRFLPSFLPSICQASALARVSGRFGQELTFLGLSTSINSHDDRGQHRRHNRRASASVRATPKKGWHQTP
ncbi:MAG: hypothetical protein IPJ62_13045 [Betaproteobacteria bacterium]|nr:hypothetical protein [Betaproteobacteria bacterium]